MRRQKTFIIAEAGVNHNGSMKIAKRLVDVAIEAKCDAVKFQTFKTKNLVAKSASMADYQKKQISNKSIKTQFDLIRSLELSFSDFLSIKEYCDRYKITFLSTPFDMESFDFLSSLKMKMYKISSGDLTNIPFLRAVSKKRKPIILSTGMAEIDEIKEAVQAIRKESTSPLYLLHCVTDYPASMKDLNLKVIPELKKRFNLPVGFSDHSMGIEASIGAVVLGAQIIEKHFTLDRAMKGPDHNASITPQELMRLVSSVRNIETAMGDGVKKRSSAEKKYVKLVRKSLVAAKDIPRGKIIEEEDIVIKRPGTGIHPREFNKILGKKVRRKILEDLPLKSGDIE